MPDQELETVGRRQGGPRMYIGGEWVAAIDGATLPSVNPANEQQIDAICSGSAHDVERAVEAAERAAHAWAATPVLERARLFDELANRIEAETDRLTTIEVADSGLPITAVRDELRGAVRSMRYFAGLATELKGTTYPVDSKTLAYSVREPYGVVGRMVPFNHPARFAITDSTVVILAGNCLVLKPSEHTSLTALEFARITHGLLPDGVLNVVTGTGRDVGRAIARHPRIPRVAATGGVATGAAIIQDGSIDIKDVSLELGGKNAMIVFPDVDPVEAAGGALSGMNLRKSMGQSCQSNSRVFVHEEIAERFLEALVDEISTLRVGDPMDPQSDLGPLAFSAHYQRVLGYVERGRSDGTMLTGGLRPRHLDRGYYLEPTVFGDVALTSPIAQEEIFGPVFMVNRWRNLDEVIDEANRLPFGLTAKVWTNDLSAAHLTAQRLQAGYVWVNNTGQRFAGTPFGGYKRSGLGKKGDLSELLSYTREKLIAVSL